MRVVYLLLALAVVPVGGAVYRLIDLALWPMTDDSARYHLAPVVTVLHVAGGSLFMALGPLQLIPRLRRYRWHARAGRVVVVAGLAAALSGLWMTHSFPVSTSNPELIYGFRMAFGTAWAAFLILAVMAIRAGDIATHRAHMVRALAASFGGGTSFVLLMTWFAMGGRDTSIALTHIQGLAWMINLAIAEVALLRPAARKVLS